MSAQAAERAWVKAALVQFHYLGFGGAVGENLQYVVRDGQGRPLACLVFGAAAWKCQGRDQFIGWSAPQRQRHLGLVANNTRFLILPWVKVPHLASWILGQISRRIARDWQAKYGHGLVLLETFVERERFRGHGLSCGQLAGGGGDHRAHAAGSAHLYSSPRQRHLSLSAAARLPGGAASMKSREELQREFAGNPAGLLEYIGQLQEQLNQKEQLLAATHQELAQHQQELARQEQLLAEARAYIAELKRQLFGPKADKLTPEQEEQLRQLTGDLREQAQRPAPLSQDVLEPERPPKDKEKLQREARRRVRHHPLPVQLEVQQVVLEPEDKVCGHCQQEGRRIGQETTTEYEYLPAKLICKETVRPKYAHDCPCGPEDHHRPFAAPVGAAEQTGLGFGGVSSAQSF